MNQEIQHVLDDSKSMKMAWAAGYKYAAMLSEDEIYNCILHAIWKAIGSFDEDRGECEFTTYLHNGVQLECLNYQQRNVMTRDFPRERGSIRRHIDEVYLTDDRVDMLDELDNSPDPEVMFDRFYNNMTFQEIADKNGWCRQNVAQKVGKNIDFLKRRLQSGV